MCCSRCFTLPAFKLLFWGRDSRIMGKISVRSKRKRRSNLEQNINDPDEAGGALTQFTTSTLNANLSVSDGSSVSSPALCRNSVSGDLNIFFNKIDVAVTATTESVLNEEKPSTKGALDGGGTFSTTILRTPKKARRKPRTIFRRSRGKGRHSAVLHSVSRCRLTYDDNMGQPDLHESEEDGECTPLPGGHTPYRTNLTGEITGTRVTAHYPCYKCGSEIQSSFKAKTFKVKCTECKHSWRCAKLQCTCTAEITIELFDGRKKSVVLNDSLLRSVISFKREGYCNTDTIEKKVLSVGNIRVDYIGGHPIRVQTVAADLISA